MGVNEQVLPWETLARGELVDPISIEEVIVDRDTIRSNSAVARLVWMNTRLRDCAMWLWRGKVEQSN